MLPVYEGTERKNSLVGGASLWVIAGKKDEEYKAAAAFLNFLAKPEEALTWSTVTGYIPVRQSGFDYLQSQNFYDKAPYKGRELAIKSLTFSAPTDVTRGQRLGGLLQIRQEISQRPAGDLHQQCRRPGLARRRRDPQRRHPAPLRADL